MGFKLDVVGIDQSLMVILSDFRGILRDLIRFYGEIVQFDGISWGVVGFHRGIVEFMGVLSDFTQARGDLRRFKGI